MTEREALKLALEALERGETGLRWKAITAIKEALAQPVIDKSAAVRIATSLGWEPKRKPLTDEEIGKIAGETLDPWSCARAIEAAHGIKGEA